MTRDQIQEMYAGLCKEVGDLYFQITHAEASLKTLHERMGALRARRDELHKAFQDAPVAAPTPAEVATDVAAPVDAPAG